MTDRSHYYEVSCGPSVDLSTYYRQPRIPRFESQPDLHSGEYFIAQAERDLQRHNRTLYRSTVIACAVSALIYAAWRFLT